MSFFIKVLKIILCYNYINCCNIAFCSQIITILNKDKIEQSNNNILTNTTNRIINPIDNGKYKTDALDCLTYIQKTSHCIHYNNDDCIKQSNNNLIKNNKYIKHNNNDISNNCATIVLSVMNLFLKQSNNNQVKNNNDESHQFEYITCDLNRKIHDIYNYIIMYSSKVFVISELTLFLKMLQNLYFWNTNLVTLFLCSVENQNIIYSNSFQEVFHNYYKVSCKFYTLLKNLINHEEVTHKTIINNELESYGDSVCNLSKYILQPHNN